MADPEFTPPNQPPTPQWRVLGVLVAVIIIVALVVALGALSYVVFGIYGLVFFAILLICLLFEAAGEVVGCLLGKLFNWISDRLGKAGLNPNIPEPVTRRFRIVVTVAALAGAALLYVAMMSYD